MSFKKTVVSAVLVKCWKVAQWKAKKLPKIILTPTEKLPPKLRKSLPNFLDIFVQTLIKRFVFVSLTIIANIGQETSLKLSFKELLANMGEI